MTSNGTTRSSRYDGQLLAAFIGGASLDDASRTAGCSRRTAARRKLALRPELDAARAQLVETTLATMQAALPAAALGATEAVRALATAVPDAARHLVAVANQPDAEPAVVTRAAVELLSAANRAFDLVFNQHGRMKERTELEARLATLERLIRSGQGNQRFNWKDPVHEQGSWLANKPRAS